MPFTYRLMTRAAGSATVSSPRATAGSPPPTSGGGGSQPHRGRSRPFPDLFEKATYAHLATIMPDGTPHVTPVWVDWDGRHVLVNSAAGRQKDLNMTKRREVAIEIPDPDNPNRYLHVRGPVVDVTEDGADAHLDRLARRYLGRDTYPPGWKFAGEVRHITGSRPQGLYVGSVGMRRGRQWPPAARQAGEREGAAPLTLTGKSSTDWEETWMPVKTWVTTAFGFEGCRVSATLGIVRGITVRSRSVIGTIGASLQTLIGGNITLYTELCERARQEAFDLMLQHASELGANAVIGMRYDANEVAQGVTEVLAYGTAVVVEALPRN